MAIPQIFDRRKVRLNRQRAGADRFLNDWTLRQLIDRLSDVRRQFPLALQIGGSSSSVIPRLDREISMGMRSSACAEDDKSKIGTLITMDCAGSPSVIGEAEALPILPGSMDLIISPLALHTVNDVPGTFAQIRRALKPDGLFMAGLLGGDTLTELRTALTQAELETTGGASLRVAPFAQIKDLADLMQRAGFALPVIDSEKVVVTYPSLFHLARDLRAMGEGNALQMRSRRPGRKSLFLRAAEHYAALFSEPDGCMRATFEIIFVTGWAPHPSQQKPLRPGSADHSLAEALGSQR